MITYSTNHMGPWALQWYIDNGFTRRVTKIASFDIPPHHRAGEPYEYDEIVEHWCGGRIDIRGTEDMYPDEMCLPVMKAEDFYRLRDWFRGFQTDTVWTLAQIVEEYEKTNPVITWFKRDSK